MPYLICLYSKEKFEETRKSIPRPTELKIYSHNPELGPATKPFQLEVVDWSAMEVDESFNPEQTEATSSVIQNVREDTSKNSGNMLSPENDRPAATGGSSSTTTPSMPTLRRKEVIDYDADDSEASSEPTRVTTRLRFSAVPTSSITLPPPPAPQL